MLHGAQYGGGGALPPAARLALVSVDKDKSRWALSVHGSFLPLAVPVSPPPRPESMQTTSP